MLEKKLKKNGKKIGGSTRHPQTRYPPSQARHPPPDQAPPRDQTPPPDQATEFLTHAYENITLPQTSFAGGNNQKRNGQ